MIGHPLEAEVLLGGGGDFAEFIRQEWETIREISIISELNELHDAGEDGARVFSSEEIVGLDVLVRPAKGGKCERCWTRSTTVGQTSEHPQICGRCAAVVANMDLHAAD